MISSRSPFRLALLAGVAALALTGAPACAATPRDPDFVDLGDHNREIEKWRSEQQAELRRQGRATAEEFRKIDAEALNRARAAEVHRTRALEALSKKTGAPLTQGSGGTQPAQGRGTLGDIDTDSLSPKDFQKTIEAAKKAGYTVEQQGDAFTIKELDTTVHRAPSEHVSQTGSSGRAAEIARGNNPETAMGLGRNDPAISVADNLKKAAHTVNTPADAITGDELQKLGKMTGRNADAVTQVTGASVDPVTRQQADLLKQGYSPEAAGIVRDNATPEQRAQDIADFQSRAKQVSVEAAKAADAHAAQTMDKLAGDARHANEVLEATKATGDEARVSRAQAQADAANKAVVDYHETRTAAQNAAVANDPDAAKIVNEARGVSNEGKSPSEIRDAATAPDRKALTQAAAEPTKAPASEPGKSPFSGEAVKTPPPGEGVKPPGVSEAGGAEGAAGKGGAGSTAIKGAGAALAGWAIYQGVKKGAEEAGKEAAEKGDGALTSTVKTIGYSAWHGIGIGPAIETGKKAGEESAKQWEKDVKEGKVDPTSKASQYWAQIRAVGWGVSEFTGLQAIKDAIVEGGGYVKDRYGQYQAEKAEAKANADKAAGAKAGDKTADKTAAGDPKTADKTSEKTPDKTADKTGEKPADGKDKSGEKDKTGQPADKDKAAADKAAADKAAAEKAAAEKAAADKLAADKAAAEKAAADKAARDKRDKDKEKDLAKEPLGSGVAAAGAKEVKQTSPTPVVAPPPPPPPPPAPAPATTEVEGGWLKDKNGTTKVVYINDAAGNRIGGYYVHYDASGREIGRESFKESPPEPQQPTQQPAAALSGHYVGRISGQAGGSFEMTVSGASVSGRISGAYQGDAFSSSFSGAINADGGFSAAAHGVLQGNLGGKISPYPFNGVVSGRVDGRAGSGNWSGKNQWGAAAGQWSARK